MLFKMEMIFFKIYIQNMGFMLGLHIQTHILMAQNMNI